MKKVNILITLIIGAMMVASCSTDIDSNPTYQQPENFVLNEPGLASTVIDLVNAKTVVLTTTQPDYGFTAATTYSVQVSLNDKWENATEETEATFEELETSSSKARIESDAVELDKAIVRLSKWTSEAELPEAEMEVYVRLKAMVNPNLTPVYSNSVKLTVLPYYIELKVALPATYYLIGECIGDGSWTNEVAKIGVSLIPMSLVKDFEYDKIKGSGEFVYTGYFPADKGFKLIGVPGSWDEQWGNGGGNGINSPVYNDGGSGNFVVPEAGWYTVTLNSIDNKVTIVKDENQTKPDQFDAMELVGTFEGWGTTPVVMTLVVGENSHVWFADVTFDADADLVSNPADPEGCKFRTDSSWSNDWGGADFPFALTGNSNIPYKAGTYKVVFNDLNACYYFIEIVE